MRNLRVAQLTNICTRIRVDGFILKNKQFKEIASIRNALDHFENELTFSNNKTICKWKNIKFTEIKR